MFLNFILFCLSALLVALGQPAWLPAAGVFTAACGFALFWKSMLFFPQNKQRFWLSVLWFGFVQAVQLSWMTSTHYLGFLILPVYVLLLVGLGIQFGLLSLCVSFYCKNSEKPILFHQCLGLAGFWTFFEWGRVFFLSGFTWNPIGLTLSCSSYSIQFASLLGIYGLSFWVVLVNLTALNVFIHQKLNSKVLWVVLALIPYGFGWVHQVWVETYYEKSISNFSVALVETGLTVEQKYGDEKYPNDWISPLSQWALVWGYLNPSVDVDLIVLPEGALPGTSHNFYYSLEEVKIIWAQIFGEKSLSSFPSLKSPLAFPYVKNKKVYWKVNNAFLAQSLSNYFQAQVIIGLNDDSTIPYKYNAAFCFHPNRLESEKHFKTILAPVGEYIPLSGISWIARLIEENFGICDSFDLGCKSTVFSGLIPTGVVICLEEMYSETVRELRNSGAELLVSLSNDVWFPNSRLAQQHFDHAKIRAVENGVYLLRSSNMGITGGVDCLGKSLPCLVGSGEQKGALYLSLPIYSYPTLYSKWGDRAVLLFSIFFISFLVRTKIFNEMKKKK